MKTKKRCPICEREIYTGMYCTDCTYSDTATIPNFEAKILQNFEAKILQKMKDKEKFAKKVVNRH